MKCLTLFLCHRYTQTREETHTVLCRETREEHAKRNRRRRQRSSVLSQTNATAHYVWLAEKIEPEKMKDAERKGLVSRLYAMQVRFQQPSLFSIFSMDGTCANILMRCARGRRAGGCDAGGRNADGRGAGVATTKLKP